MSFLLFLGQQLEIANTVSWFAVGQANRSRPKHTLLCCVGLVGNVLIAEQYVSTSCMNDVCLVFTVYYAGIEGSV